jgi:hypothetical protein
LAKGTIGFGLLHVNGLRRVPSPPAMITAFIRFILSSGFFHFQLKFLYLGFF